MERIGRRDLLIGAGAGTVALATLGLSATPAAAASDHQTDDGESGSLVGAWMITHVDDPSQANPNPTPSQAVGLFAAGGTFTSRDINPPGSSQLGAWAKTGDDSFTATFWDDTGGDPPGGTVKIVLEGTWSGDQLSGTFSFTVLDGKGATLFSGAGTFKGTRIEAGE